VFWIGPVLWFYSFNNNIFNAQMNNIITNYQENKSLVPLPGGGFRVVESFERRKKLPDYSIGTLTRSKRFKDGVRLYIKPKAAYLSCEYDFEDFTASIGTQIVFLPPEQKTVKAFHNLSLGLIMETNGTKVIVVKHNFGNVPSMDWLPYYLGMVTKIRGL
jgi:hypothetical protein